MQIIDSISEMQAWSTNRRNANQSIALVPTLGCLHKGHAHLLDTAKSNNDRVILSLFVNPIQFRRKQYDAYPRDFDADLKLAKSCNVDAIFVPSVQEMYPHAPSLDWLFALQDGHTGSRDPNKFTIDQVGTNASMPYIRVPDRLVMRMDGKLHPWHFDGVATVVRMLFDATIPDRAYFGEKDIQQLAILESMNRWLTTQTQANPIQIIPTPIIRDPDGLASSSRLTLLSPQQRNLAVEITNAIEQLAITAQSSPHHARNLLADFASAIDQMNSDGMNLEIDSIEIVDPVTLEPVEHPAPGHIIYAAFLIDGIRLAETRKIGPSKNENGL